MNNTRAQPVFIEAEEIITAAPVATEDESIIATKIEARAQLALFMAQGTRSDREPLTWWKNNGKHFSLLVPLARILLAIPASSATSERMFSALFSVTGGITERRPNISEEKIAELFFWKQILLRVLVIK